MTISKSTLGLLVVCCAAQSPTSSLRERYQEIGGKLFAPLRLNDTNKGPRDAKIVQLPEEDATKAVSDLHDLTTGVITNALSTSPRLDAAQLLGVVEELQGDYSGRDRELGERGLPYAHLTRLSGVMDAFLVAFAVMKGPLAAPAPDPFLQFYVKTPVGWKLGSEVDHGLEGLTIEIAPVTSGTQDEFWVIVWGMRIGDTGARVSVRLYAFGTSGVRTLYTRDNLHGGKVEVDRTRVILTYYDIDPERRRPPVELREESRVTPLGLQ